MAGHRYVRPPQGACHTDKCSCFGFGYISVVKRMLRVLRSVDIVVDVFCRMTRWSVLQLREYKRERKISNDKLEDESDELRKIKKVSESVR